MKVKIRQIVEATGYSIATVSRALNGNRNVAPEAKTKILACARDLGFFEGKQTVMVIFPDCRMPYYFSKTMVELETLLTFAGYKLEMIPLSALSLVEEHNLCGVISICSEDGLERYWSKKHILPLVCINTRPRHLDGIFTVASNDEQGTRLLLEHLIGLGHTKIAMVGQQISNPLNYNNHLRLEIFRRILREHRLPDRYYADLHGDLQEWPGELSPLLHAGITAIIVTAEGMASQLIYQFRSFGIRVPEDISIVGWLAEEQDKYCSPPVTGIVHNFSCLAKQAFIMLEKILHREAVNADVWVDYNYYERSSTAPPPSGSRSGEK